MNQSEDGRKEKPPKAVISGFKRFSPICRRHVVAETGIEPVRQRLRILSPLRLPISSLGDSVHNYGRGRHFSEKLSAAGKPCRFMFPAWYPSTHGISMTSMTPSSIYMDADCLPVKSLSSSEVIVQNLFSFSRQAPFHRFRTRKQRLQPATAKLV